MLLAVACGSEQPTPTSAGGLGAEAGAVTGIPPATSTALPLIAPGATRSATATAMPTTAPSSPTATDPPPSAAPSVAPSATLAGCLEDTGAVAMPPGFLRIAYELDGQWWEWREETGLAEPSPGSAPFESEYEALWTLGGQSADGRFLLEARQPEDGQYELWVSAPDGTDPRRLVAITPDVVFERYPQATGVELQAGWVDGTSLVAYHFTPLFEGIGGVPIQELGIVNAEDGRTWYGLPADVAWTFRFSEDGRRLLAITDAGLWIVETSDGALLHDVPLDVVVPYEQGIMFTPDGSRIILYTESGFALVNPIDGTVTEIAVDYAPIGAGHTSILPPIQWLADHARFYTLTTTDDVWNDLEAQFTVWLVDTETGSATALNSFTGFYPSVVFSPDRRIIAYWVQSRDNVRPLYLADVMSGEQFPYDTLPVLEFVGWSPAGRQFLYSYRPFETTFVMLGDICAPPLPLPRVNVTLNGDIQWVDGQRLLVLEGAPGDSERPLRLISLDGSGVTIAVLAGEEPHYSLYFGE